MAKITPEQQAIQALAQALADGAPKILFGSARKPGIFVGSSQANKKAAQLCLDEKWLEPTGEFDGAGRSRKEKYRITPAGTLAALERSEPVQLLRQALAVSENLARARDELLRKQQEILHALRLQDEAMQQAMQKQRTLIDNAVERLRSPLAPARKENPAPGWRSEALDYLDKYQHQHIQAFSSLPDLYVQVVQKHGISIGQFHDAMRALVQEGQIRLHPFTGARYALEREEYALLAGKEIMYYAERLAHA